MSISKRLLKVCENVPKCKCIADIGCDHGYVTIYLLQNEICEKVIATDINEGPLEKAKVNGAYFGFNGKIDFRLGAGLQVIDRGECEAAIISGMGGHLIKDIIIEDEAKFKSLNKAILQPVQNPEALRKFLYDSSYYIENEDLVYDEGKYYQIIVVDLTKTCNYGRVPEINYEFSPRMLSKGGVVLKEYLNYNIYEAQKIYDSIKETTKNAIERKEQLKFRIESLKEML